MAKMAKSGEGADWYFQLLAPHEEGLIEELKSYGVFPKDFLEKDQALKWLWPIWKKTQMQILKDKPAQIC